MIQQLFVCYLATSGQIYRQSDWFIFIWYFITEGEVKSNSYELQFNERLGSAETLCASSADKDLEAS